MITNLLIIAFLIGMTYWWGFVQGLFSALLHLLITLVAAAIAIAIWEPVCFILMDRMPLYAWGVSLLAPFVLLLVALRLTADKLVPSNVRYPTVVNMIVGGVFGLLSGILTAGLTIVGLGFLPLGEAIGGYQPYAVGDDGKVQQADRLWVPVDRMAVQWLSRMSRGSLSPVSRKEASLALYQPDLHKQAGLFRMRNDPNASVVATPKSIEVIETYVTNTLPPDIKENIGPAIPQALSETGKLMIVDTQWTLTAGTFDKDRTLRLPPMHIRLGTWLGNRGNRAHLHAPIAVSKTIPGSSRALTIVDSASSSAYGIGQEVVLGWVFAIPEEHEPKFILLRHTRVMLPEDALTDEASFADALGRIPPPEEPEPERVADARSKRRSSEARSERRSTRVKGRVGIKTGVVGYDIQLTDELPQPVSRNMATRLDIDGKGAILSGYGDVGHTRGSLSAKLRVTKIFVPRQQACVRVQMDRDKAQSLLGKARSNAAGLGAIFLKDNLGQTWQPDGYVWLKADGTQRIKYDQPIRSARELPHTEMQKGEKLYLYFAVQRGIEIRELWLGQSTQQRIDPPLVVPK